MPKYFIGNVLSPQEKEHKAENDPTFAFSSKEAKDLDLTNLPIRMEHHPEMEVGTIMRNWQAEDGSVWVTGRLNDDTLESKFANYAIEKNPTTGESYYTGLSLQHTHIQYASKQNTKKEGIEVSLCVNPRRSDCRIAFVDSEPNQAKTKKIVYKIHSASFKTNMSEEKIIETPTTQEATPVESAPVTETPVVEVPKTEAPQTTEMSKEDMMRVIIQQQKELEDSQSKKSTEVEELRELKAMIEKQKEEEEKKISEKSYALAKATIDQWAETLDKTEMDEASRDAIMKLAKDHPQESLAMLKVAHCASAKHKATKSQFNDYKEVMKRSQLQEKFEQVMSKKRPAQQVIHAASTKKVKVAPAAPKQDNVQRFLKAMSKYNVSGSARDHMVEVSKIGQRRGNQPRAPYY